MSINKLLSNINNATTFKNTYLGNPSSDLSGYAGYVDTAQDYTDYSNNPDDYRALPDHVTASTTPSIAAMVSPTMPVGSANTLTPPTLAVPPTAVINGHRNPVHLQLKNWYKNSPTVNQAKTAWGQASLGERANAVVGTVGSLLSAYNGFKNTRLAKEQFHHAKETAERNWQAQRKQTNSQLEDRQRRRVEEAQANGRSTTSVSDYMAKYGV